MLNRLPGILKIMKKLLFLCPYSKAGLMYKPFVLIATGSYIGEGFDEPRLDTLFLAMPIAWKGTLHQNIC